ncbi:putative ATP-dependent RNA helicase TDRD12 [Diorhabda carinulata]|uniref:putative ATP-dependent RNA helicase TDRD12 n=1 Tax=Diorhabda carinulata TaxID=1163345 RepID=UPI0025A1D7EA|nr:putative ATP-dependent RNA helicase TDRD12 [Diorhabda carinulata]
MKECVTITNDFDSTSNYFKKGEIVAAQINNKLYRAIIEDIIPKNSWKITYILWLVDLGTMKEANYVFNLPTNLRKTPHFALQASLNNVKYVNQILEYNSYGELVKINKGVLNPTPSSRQEAMNFLSTGHNFKFSLEKEEDGILFGDILFKNKENEQISLRDCLYNTGAIVKEPIEGVTDFINNYKERNLTVISKICQNEPQLFENKINESVATTCKTIVSKILEEFQCSDTLTYVDKETEPLCSISDSKNLNTSLDHPLPDNKSPSVKKLRIFQVIEKLRDQKNVSKLNQSSTSDATADTIEDRSKNKNAIESASNYTENKTVDQLTDKDVAQSTSKMNELMKKMRKNRRASKLNQTFTSDTTENEINDKSIEIKSASNRNQLCGKEKDIEKGKWKYELDLVMEGKIILGPAGSERTLANKRSKHKKNPSSPKIKINKNYIGTNKSPKKMVCSDNNSKIIELSSKEELKLEYVQSNSSEAEASINEKNKRMKEQRSEDSSNSTRCSERKFHEIKEITISPITPKRFSRLLSKKQITGFKSNSSDKGSFSEKNMDPTPMVTEMKKQSSDDSPSSRRSSEETFNEVKRATSPFCSESNSSHESSLGSEENVDCSLKVTRTKEQSSDDSFSNKGCSERKFNEVEGATAPPIHPESSPKVLEQRSKKLTIGVKSNSPNESSFSEQKVDPTPKVTRMKEQSSDDSSNSIKWSERKFNEVNNATTSFIHLETSPKVIDKPSKETLTSFGSHSSSDEGYLQEQNVNPYIDSFNGQKYPNKCNKDVTSLIHSESISKTVEQSEELNLTDADCSSSKEEASLTDVKCNSSKENGSLTDCNMPSSDCQHLQPVQPLKIKPHCNCTQCTIWTKEEDISLENMDTTSKVAKIKGTRTYLLFKENETGDSVLNINSVDYASMNKVDKQSTQKVLVHSELMINPVHQIPKLTFHSDIHISLYDLQYRQARRIQIYTWSAILRNQHVFMIHGPRTGKSMAYMPCMLTFILEKHDRYATLLKVSGGPIVIILCRNTDKCEQLSDLAKLLMQNKKCNISLVTYPLGHVNTSHTDMLITTPDILIDLLRNNSINFKKLCHLVIEDGDTLLTKYKEAMDVIFELCQSMLRNRLFSKSLQLVVCSEHWTSHMKHLIKKLYQVPLICIGNPLEAAFYGQVEISMKFKDTALKEQELENILKEDHRIYRTIVICEEHEMDEIVKMLGFRGIDYIAVPSSLGAEDILHLEVVWKGAKGGSYSVLICSDFVLNTFLNITCAEVLIHYSLPSTWTKFIKRFICLLENCKSPLVTKSVKYFAKTIIMYDGIRNEPLKKFLNYVASTDLKKHIPLTLQKYSENLKKAEEEEKLKEDICLCANLKLFGYCKKIECPQRHILNSDSDVSQHFPKSGKIKFKIVNIIDVSVFTIKLLQHVDNDNKIYEYDETSNITEDLSTSLKLGKKKVSDPVLGKRYAFHNIDEQDPNYYRCEVLNIDKENVKINLLDKGTVINSTVTRLFYLPKEFDIHVKPRQTIDCYLANCIPPYRDENYSAKSFFNVKVMLESKDYKNIIFTGDIRLQLNNTLWLKDVYEEIVLSDVIIPRFQLSREIIIQKLVESKSNQLDSLYKLCAEFGIDLPKYDTPIVKVPVKKRNVEKNWAYLDTERINEVTFTSAFSPDEIYVKLNKFNNLLNNLQKEIQRSIEMPNYPKIREVTIGDVYLAKDPNGNEYCRVLALKIQDDQVLCFYVDFGDEAVIKIENLKHIQDVYITKLPFQCIACRLYGIRPIYNAWDENVTNMLYNYAHEPNTDIFRTLYLKVCRRETSSIITPTKYSVLLKDGLDEKKTLINQILIECGTVVANPDEILEDFEIPAPQQGPPELDEHLEEAAYICRKTEELDRFFEANAGGFDSTTDQSGNKKGDNNSDDLELFTFGDPIDFLINLVTGNETSPTDRIRELPSITAAPSTDYCTPDVYWSQTESTVKLSIRLADIKDYKLTLTKGRMFDFKTIYKDKTYCLKLILYRLIETIQHTSLGPEIRVVMTKSTTTNWPRLILSKQKARNIHYDANKLSIEENEGNKILQLPKEFSDCFDELNEEDPMYTVYSDLDSDLDEELENDSD